MLNIAYTDASVDLAIFHYYMLQNKQSNRHSLYGMTSLVVFFAYPIKLNISVENVASRTVVLDKITHICLKVFTKSYKRSLAHGLRRHYHTVTPQL